MDFDEIMDKEQEHKPDNQHPQPKKGDLKSNTIPKNNDKKVDRKNSTMTKKASDSNNIFEAFDEESGIRWEFLPLHKNIWNEINLWNYWNLNFPIHF